jgi:hypothetical protein
MMVAPAGAVVCTHAPKKKLKPQAVVSWWTTPARSMAETEIGPPAGTTSGTQFRPWNAE